VVTMQPPGSVKSKACVNVKNCETVFKDPRFREATRSTSHLSSEEWKSNTSIMKVTTRLLRPLPLPLVHHLYRGATFQFHTKSGRGPWVFKNGTLTKSVVCPLLHSIRLERHAYTSQGRAQLKLEEKYRALNEGRKGERDKKTMTVCCIQTSKPTMEIKSHLLFSPIRFVSHLGA
jgi:hypothetical protein